jgi:hypothetical protein
MLFGWLVAEHCAVQLADRLCRSVGWWFNMCRSVFWWLISCAVQFAGGRSSMSFSWLVAEHLSFSLLMAVQLCCSVG